MIYVDVTAACLLRLQTGIPRTTREIFRLLNEHRTDVVPVVWQPCAFGYHAPSSYAHRLLDDPFAGRAPRETAPRDSTVPLLWAGLREWLRFPPAVPLERRLGSQDIFLLTSLFPDNRLGYLKRLEGKAGRKIAIFHDAIPLADQSLSSWEEALHRSALRRLASFDLVICVSATTDEDLKRLWREQGITPARTVVLPWPVPFTGPRPPAMPPAATPLTILYVSRLKRVKNHQTLFDACRKLWDEKIRFDLELIGCEDDRSESQPVLQSITQMQTAGLPIRWRAQVTEPELHEAYRRAAFTVFPSRAEGFGLPIIESLWHGRPVICGDFAAMGELAREGGCRTVDIGDPNALAAAMRELLQNESALAALSRVAAARPLRTWNDYWLEFEPLLR